MHDFLGVYLIIATVLCFVAAIALVIVMTQREHKRHTAQQAQAIAPMLLPTPVYVQIPVQTAVRAKPAPTCRKKEARACQAAKPSGAECAAMAAAAIAWSAIVPLAVWKLASKKK